MWLGAQSAFEPTVVERLDAMFAAGDCPDAVVVFVDAWTSLGGSQFLNSLEHRPLPGLPVRRGRARSSTSATRRMPGREHRGIAGKSSGGYGAMVVPMLRPDVFGALASHAGDALFESCYLPEFPVIARQLRDDFDGSYESLLSRMPRRRRSTGAASATPFSMYAYACAYTPDPDSPGKALLPFDIGHRAADRRHLGALAGARPGADGRAARRRAAQHAPDLPRRRAPGRVLPRPRGAGVLRRARRGWASPTRSSCSTATTAASPTATRARSGELVLALREPMTATAENDLAFAGPGGAGRVVARRRGRTRASWSSCICAGSRRSIPG